MNDHFLSPAGAFVAGKSEISHRYDGVATIEVDAVGVREIVSEVDLIKVDAKGMECEILQGLSGVIHERRPTIFVELLDGTPKLRALVDHLCRSAGYSLYAPASDGLLPIDVAAINTVSVEERFRSRDVILCVDSAVPEVVVSSS